MTEEFSIRKPTFWNYKKRIRNADDFEKSRVWVIRWYKVSGWIAVAALMSMLSFNIIFSVISFSYLWVIGISFMSASLMSKLICRFFFASKIYKRTASKEIYVLNYTLSLLNAICMYLLIFFTVFIEFYIYEAPTQILFLINYLVIIPLSDYYLRSWELLRWFRFTWNELVERHNSKQSAKQIRPQSTSDGE